MYRRQILGTNSRHYQLSRRRLIAMGVTVPIAVVACGEDGEAPGREQQSDGDLSAEQVMRFADDASGFSTGLDPQLAPSSPDHGWIRQIFNGLLRFQPGNQNIIDPDLAEDWEISDDGLVWTFHLRQGVQFHHGYGEMTADDVVFTIDRAKNPDESLWAEEYTSVSRATALDDYTVEIVLEHPAPFLHRSLANVRAGMIVSRKAVEELGEDFRNNPVGTGPFFLESYTPNQAFTLTAHEQYFRGRPILDRIEVSFVPDPQARLLALNSGEVHAARGHSSQDWIDQVGEDIAVLDGERGGRALIFNMTVEPFNDARVRQALHHAYNWEDIAALLGPELVSHYPTHLDPDWPEYQIVEGQIPTYPYDPDRARELLAEAGYPDGFDVPMVMSNQENSITPMEVIQNQFAQVGVNLQMDVVEHTAYREATDQFENPMGIIGPRRDNPDSQMRTYYHSESEGSFNWSGYGIVEPTDINPISANGIDELLDEAARELDDDKRNQLYGEAQIQVMEDLPQIPIYFIMSTPNAYNTRTFDYGYPIETSPPGSFMYEIGETSRILAD